MNKFLRPVLLASMAAAAVFSVQAQYSYGSYSSYDGGSCESGDGSRQSSSLQVVGLTEDQRLICFNERNPGDARDLGAISGLAAGDTLIGIDFRVQDKKMYGVGLKGGIYTIETARAVATKVSQLTVALDGKNFGVDFNPAADRLRIVSDTGQNLRHNVNAGGVTVVDGGLNYTAGTAALGVTGSAYTNNDLDPTTATTLYALDTTLDQIAIQSPPNNGSLAATGKLTLDVLASAGFDIYSKIRNGVTVEVQSLASLKTSATETGLYSISLPTGKATSRGSFASQYKVMDIAIPLNQL